MQQKPFQNFLYTVNESKRRKIKGGWLSFACAWHHKICQKVSQISFRGD